MGRVLTRARRIAMARWARAVGAAHDRDEGFEDPPEGFAGDASGSPPREEVEAHARARAILEVGPEATAAEIRSAYRRICRRYHPDRFQGDARKLGVAHELLTEVNRAYALLSKR